MNYNKLLLNILIITQFILWISYWYMFTTTKNLSIFWGNVNKNFHNYFLTSASLAYILNLILIIYYIFSKNIEKSNINIINWSVFTYYSLQLLFLPFVKFLKPIFTQILLFICVIPLFLIMMVSINQSFYTNKIIDKIILLVCSIIPFLHVLINDAILYGLNI